MLFMNKVAIVTGASAGIGRAISVAYARQGARLVLSGRNEENLMKTAALCEEQGSKQENILQVPGDVTEERVCNNLVDKTIGKFGCLDVLRSSILAYSMAKAALNQFTKCLAQDVGPSGVRVNCIMPGAVNTDIIIRPGAMLNGGTQEDKARHLARSATHHTLGRIGHVDEVAAAVLFVSSEAASFMTGAEVVVDGGMSGKSAF